MTGIPGWGVDPRYGCFHFENSQLLKASLIELQHSDGCYEHEFPDAMRVPYFSAELNAKILRHV